VGREELRWLLDADFFWDRAKGGSEALHGFLGFEDAKTQNPLGPSPAAWTSRPSKGRSAGDSIRLFPVRRRTTSSYFSRVRLGV
jgi:hypothetical protein